MFFHSLRNTTAWHVCSRAEEAKTEAKEGIVPQLKRFDYVILTYQYIC